MLGRFERVFAFMAIVYPTVTAVLSILALALTSATCGGKRSAADSLAVAEELAGAAVEAADPPTAPVADPAIATATATDADGFHANFPSPPRRATHDGVSQYTARDEHGGVYTVAVVTYPAERARHFNPNPLALFALEARKLRESFGGDVFDDTVGVVAGRGARDLTLRGGKRRVRAHWVAAGTTLFTLLVDWPAIADANAELRAADFVTSFALTAAAPADLPVVWSRHELAGFAFTAPPLRDPIEAPGITIAEAELPLPAATCSVLFQPAGRDATSTVREVALKTAQGYFAKAGEPSESQTRIGSIAARLYTYQGSLSPEMGGGDGTLRIASFTTEHGEYALLGHGWQGGDALIDRCWQSFEETPREPAHDDGGDTAPR